MPFLGGAHRAYRMTAVAAAVPRGVQVANASPELYVEGLERIHFNARVFVAWVGRRGELVFSMLGHGAAWRDVMCNGRLFM